MLMYGVCFCWNFENIKSAKTHRPDVAFLSSRVTCLFHLHCLSVFWIDACVLFSSVSAVNSNSVRGWVNICQPDWLLLLIFWTISVVLFGFHFHGRRRTYSKEDAELKNATRERVVVSGTEWGCCKRDSPISVFNFTYPQTKPFNMQLGF
jgi:hypothetical protein